MSYFLIAIVIAIGLAASFFLAFFIYLCASYALPKTTKGQRVVLVGFPVTVWVYLQFFMPYGSYMHASADNRAELYEQLSRLETEKSEPLADLYEDVSLEAVARRGSFFNPIAPHFGKIQAKELIRGADEDGRLIYYFDSYYITPVQFVLESVCIVGIFAALLILFSGRIKRVGNTFIWT